MNRIHKRFLFWPFYVLVFLLLNACKEELNHPPDIQVFTVLQETVITNKMATFSCIATDEDEDELIYTWFCEKGTFPEGNQESQVEWQAPDEIGFFIITVNVSDGKHLTSDSLRIEVQNYEPQLPSNPRPMNGSIEAFLKDTLFWDCHDLDGDELWYRVFFGLDPDPPLVDRYNTANFHVPEMLTRDKTYYWRVDAYDIFGNKSEGPTWSFSTLSDHESFTDLRDGNDYEYKIIGTQTWMIENLAFLPDEGYYVSEYGVLYNSKAAYLACPAGWHLPLDSEWMELERSLGLDHPEYNQMNNLANLLKSASGWNDEGNGIDCHGFNSLPAGSYDYINGFSGAGSLAMFWAAQGVRSYAYCRVMTASSQSLERQEKDMKSGLSVRCIKD